MEINRNKIKLCPNCKSNMLLKKGKYGMFWGCSRYPKCKTSLNAKVSRAEFKKLEIIRVDYNKLFQYGDIEAIISECCLSNKSISDFMEEFKDYRECLENNNICYGVLAYLQNKNRYIDISKFIYAIYLVRGEVTKNFKYWINSFNYGRDYYERDIQNTIIDNWDESLFNELNLKYIKQEAFIGSFDEGGGKVDIMALDTRYNCEMIIEIKGPKSNAKDAWGQLNSYIKIYKKFYEKDVKAMIISRGYPYGVYEDIFLLVGYVIEDNKIVFIPWKF